MMALRDRAAITNILNQENVKNIKSTHNVGQGKTKRPALGEIGNKVNTVRGAEPIDRTSLLQGDKKKLIVPSKQILKPTKKVLEKPPVQIVLPLVKDAVVQENKLAQVTKKKEFESFSSDLLAVEDIDKEDHENPTLVSIYINDIYDYLRSLECKYPVHKGYLLGQNITPKMRSILIDWLIEVHQQFRLLQETLYLTVAIIDRFLQAYHTIDRKRLQLVGVTAMFIASKYEEMYSPDISDFVYVTDNAYTKEEILQMEKVIVRTLDYSLGRPLSLHFLRRYSKAGKAVVVHHTMAKYFLEQCLVHYEMCHYSPSLLAAAALYLAFAITVNNDENKDEVWTNTLTHYSTYTKADVIPVVQDIASIIIIADKSKYQAVRKKYAQSKYMKISTRPELRSPIMINATKGTV
ncbi:G2/mitotic-specific cyclin-B [Megalopta genalis]|uniref:G2/mitotic-specific cyclin-B n=1 Tax=Megalopta genalis TaxID=115081 RepID=UPI001442F425|nr:G2/mitotic-specific cyclin-B-like [Megalopta genalis]